jgi:exodeoxyribonuclease VII small subunit
MTPRAQPQNPAGEESFDQRLERLEKIVAELEQGRTGLEVAIERYQEGVELMRSCRASLEGYRKRIEELHGDGELKPFAHDPDAATRP